MVTDRFVSTGSRNRHEGLAGWTGISGGEPATAFRVGRCVVELVVVVEG
jgi:hypothetical protein